MAKKYVEVKGRDFFLDGTPIRFRGLGIGNWLNLEHFMLGLPSTDRQIRRTVAEVFGKEAAGEFFDRLAECYVTEKDFAFLRECGVNVVRVPFNYQLFMDDQNPNEWKQKGFAVFDRLLDLCEKYGIYLLPDLHAVPGAQNPDWHSDNDTGIPQFWHYKVFRDQMVSLWQKLAERWKDRECLLGYDLLNEPWLMGAPAESMLEFYRDASNAIREVDQNHIIFLEGDNFAMDFDCIREIGDPNTALTFHFYPTVWEPQLLGDDFDREGRKARFAEIMDHIISCRERLDRPVFCGEAGYENCKLGMEYAMELLGDTIELLEQRDISWTVWCYKDADFMGLCCPKSDTPWMSLVRQIGPYWTQDREKAQANALMDVIGQFPGLREAAAELKYAMQFRQRGLLFRVQAERILKPVLRQFTKGQLLELPESFLFDGCDCHQEFLGVIKKYCAERR